MMKRTFVIGAGFGGLAIAIRLQAAGINTTLLEQRDVLGGSAYVWKEQGFTFDAGPTVITDPDSIEELFILSGKLLSDYVKFMPVTPFYRLCWENGKYLDYDNNQKFLEYQITKFNPQDVYGYREFLAYSHKVFKEGYLKLSAVPFLNFRDMLRVVPQLSRLQAWRSVYSIVSKFIQDEYLRQAFSFHSLLIGGNPFVTSSIYTLIHALEYKWGVWFPYGGIGALVSGIVKLFKDIGGEILLNSEVVRLETKGNYIKGIKLKDGRYFDALAVISNADVVYTYDCLLQHHILASKRAISLKQKRMSNSLFLIYFGLNYSHPQLAHHTICFGHRYRELIYEIFNSNKLSKDFSLYLHSPCCSDPSLAPPGCGSFYVLAPVPNLGTANIDWNYEGPRFCNRIFDYLEAHYIPRLREQLVMYRIFTPYDFRDRYHAYKGSAFSFEPILTQSAWFRPHNRDADISNLYLVGAGTHPGAGVPGVINSAKATSKLILEDLFR